MVWPLLEVIDATSTRTGAAHRQPPGPFVRPSEENSARAGGTRWLAGSPGCSPPTRGSARNCWSTGSTATSAPWTRIWGGSRTCGARSWSGSPSTRPTCGTRKPLHGCGESAPTCRRGCRCSATPGSRAPTSNSSRRWPPTTTFTCGCHTPVTQLWTALDASARCSAAPRRRQPPQRTIRCWPRSAATCGSCSAAFPGHGATDEFVGGADRPDTLLGWLQSDIAANAVRPRVRSSRRGPLGAGAQLSWTGPPDRRAARGPARPVRRRRDAGTARHPGDVPGHRDLRPLIAADFGLGEMVPVRNPAHRLRVRLADRSLVQTNPLLAVASQLLALAGGRVTATEVLDLAHAAPVRARFGFTDDDLEALPGGCAGQHPVGLRPAHRAPYGITVRPEHLALRARPGAGRCRDVRRLEGLARHACRSTTSAATASSSPGGSPSSSTG